MEITGTISKLAEALAKAQAVMQPAAFDSVNPHFKSKYASLNSIMAACRKPLTDNGIAVVQSSETCDQGVVVTTILMHTSGEFIKSSIIIKPQTDTAQAIGSAITYGRRYGLASMVGITADADDDAEAATKADTKQLPMVPKKDNAKLKQIADLCTKLGSKTADETRSTISYLIGREIKSATELSGDEQDNIINGLTKQLERSVDKEF